MSAINNNNKMFKSAAMFRRTTGKNKGNPIKMIIGIRKALEKTINRGPRIVIARILLSVMVRIKYQKLTNNDVGGHNALSYILDHDDDSVNAANQFIRNNVDACTKGSLDDMVDSVFGKINGAYVGRMFASFDNIVQRGVNVVTEKLVDVYDKHNRVFIKNGTKLHMTTIKGHFHPMEKLNGLPSIDSWASTVVKRQQQVPPTINQNQHNHLNNNNNFHYSQVADVALPSVPQQDANVAAPMDIVAESKVTTQTYHPLHMITHTLAFYRTLSAPSSRTSTGVNCLYVEKMMLSSMLYCLLILMRCFRCTMIHLRSCTASQLLSPTTTSNNRRLRLRRECCHR